MLNQIKSKQTNSEFKMKIQIDLATSKMKARKTCEDHDWNIKKKLIRHVECAKWRWKNIRSKQSSLFVSNRNDF